MVQKTELKKARLKKRFIFFFSTPECVCELKGRGQSRWSDEGSVNIHLYSKYFLTFFIVKKNIKCKTNKQKNANKKKKNQHKTKVHSSMIYHKVNSHLTKKYNIARTPHSSNHFPYFPSGFCDLNMDTKNYALVCLLLKLYKQNHIIFILLCLNCLCSTFL